MNENKKVDPWSLPIDKVSSLMRSTKDGLTSAEADERLKKFGLNQLGEKEERSNFRIFISQLQNWLMLVLLMATFSAFILGEKLDALVILGIILLSALFGFFQEYRAEKTLAKLKRLVTHKARVLRDGNWAEIESKNLVAGDVVQLRLGDRVPADLRLFEVDNLSLDEAILTGESAPAVKHTQPIIKDRVLPQDQKNMAFASTYVASGVGKGLVTAIASNTYLGKTAKILETKEPQTDFQKQIRHFGSFLFKIIFAMTVFVFGVNAFLGKGIFASFLFAVALAVGITPELLPMIITVTLSQGALKLVRKKVVVKRLISVEDLGNIDTLCTDKTGTLTEGSFALSDYRTAEGDKDEEVLLEALVCSSGFAQEGKGVSASPVDKALWEWPHLNKVKSQLRKFQLLDENEFDFKRKRMSVVVEKEKNLYLIAKGAFEAILTICKKIENRNREINFDEKRRQQITKQVADYEKAGYRVIALAKKRIKIAEASREDEKDMVFKGFLLFTDPVKRSAKESLKLFKKLGVKIKVISGDSPLVVKKVAEETGLATGKERVITGDQLLGLSKQRLAEIAQEFTLFARVPPEQKWELVDGLNWEGHIVGFLGDGVNDAPALKAADVGIAVDSGAEVAKEAADIVLLKKDLKVLAEGIEAGRKTFGNITKYILNTISANFGNMFTVALSSLFLPFIPLLPTQILLNNFISDIPLLAITTDKVDASFIKKPKRWNINLIGHFMLYFGLISSIFDLATILPLILIWQVSPELFRTAWFVESALSEMLVTFSIRTRLPFYKSTPSRVLLGLSVVSGFLVVVLPLLSPGRILFNFVRLPFNIILWLGFVLIMYFAVTEVVKHLFFKRFEI